MTLIIYLIGRSGSGKYTIAKHLEKYGFKIVDNHLINNPIFSLLDLDSVTPIPESAWEAIGQIRTRIFDFMSKEYKHNYVLTNELLEDEGDHQCFKQVQEMAERRGSLFVPIRFHLSKVSVRATTPAFPLYFHGDLVLMESDQIPKGAGGGDGKLCLCGFLS